MCAETTSPPAATGGAQNAEYASNDPSVTKAAAKAQQENGLVAKWRWLDRVASDKSLPANATRVAFAIAAHVNGKSGIAWPSVERLAELLGLNSRSVRRCISALVDGGYLGVKTGGGSLSNKYTLLHDDDHVEMVHRKTDADQGVVPRTELSGGYEPPLTELSVPHGQNCQGTPDKIVTTPLTKMSGEPSEYNPLKEPSERTRVLAREAEIIPVDRTGERFKPAKMGVQAVICLEGGEGKRDPDGFAEFWLSYPKKVGRFEAAEAFREALKHSDVEELVAGAKRYDQAQQAAISDPVERERFTKSAERWLKGRHWRDVFAAPLPIGLGRHAAEAIAEAYGDEWGTL